MPSLPDRGRTFNEQKGTRVEEDLSFHSNSSDILNPQEENTVESSGQADLSYSQSRDKFQTKKKDERAAPLRALQTSPGLPPCSLICASMRCGVLWEAEPHTQVCSHHPSWNPEAHGRSRPPHCTPVRSSLHTKTLTTKHSLVLSFFLIS